MEKLDSPTTILFCVLNWGLGHASRSIPLIRHLLQQGVQVILASDGRALRLLQKEFPHTAYIELPPYKVSYKTTNMFWNMAWQLPTIARAIRAERRLLQRLITSRKIDAIISDNRFGCHQTTVPSIFMSHQIYIKIGHPFWEKLVQRINVHFIQKFDECWIPDVAVAPSLAGELSHRHSLKKVTYLGVLSRFEQYPKAKKYDLIAVLSGPEPQRTFFEKKILEQVLSLELDVLIVQGVTDRWEKKKITPSVTTVTYLTSEDLNAAILASDYVLCRSGYSSVMDLICLQKKAILVPTPGQTEQLYLMESLEQEGLFIGQHQSDLDIERGLRQLTNAVSLSADRIKASMYKEVLNSLLSNIESQKK